MNLLLTALFLAAVLVFYTRLEMRLNQRRCPACATRISVDDPERRCPQCGASIES